MRQGFGGPDPNREDWKSFQMGVVKYGFVTAGLMELISILFLGLSVRFVYGLALGTAIAVMNFRIQGRTYERILQSGSGVGVGPGLAALSFLLRMLIYSGAFLVCVKTGGACIPGVICGFLTMLCGIYYSCVFRRQIKGQKSQESEEGVS